MAGPRKCALRGCHKDAHVSKVPGLLFAFCAEHSRLRTPEWVKRAREGRLPTRIDGGVPA